LICHINSIEEKEQGWWTVLVKMMKNVAKEMVIEIWMVKKHQPPSHRD